MSVSGAITATTSDELRTSDAKRTSLSLRTRSSLRAALSSARAVCDANASRPLQIARGQRSSPTSTRRPLISGGFDKGKMASDEPRPTAPPSSSSAVSSTLRPCVRRETAHVGRPARVSGASIPPATTLAITGLDRSDGSIAPHKKTENPSPASVRAELNAAAWIPARFDAPTRSAPASRSARSRTAACSFSRTSPAIRATTKKNSATDAATKTGMSVRSCCRYFTMSVAGEISVTPPSSTSRRRVKAAVRSEVGYESEGIDGCSAAAPQSK